MYMYKYVYYLLEYVYNLIWYKPDPAFKIEIRTKNFKREIL